MDKKEESVENNSIKTNRILLICMIVLNCLTYGLVQFFNFASSSGIKFLFKNSIKNISASHEIAITPAGPTFATWGLIYLWQLLWLLFNVIIIFIKNKQNEPVFISPTVLSSFFHLFVFFNLVLNITWLFVWDSLNFTAALVVLLLMTSALYVALIISHINIFNAEEKLRQDSIWALWLYRLLVNNGLAFYATWITVATCLNLSIAITYSWTNSPEYWISTSGLISLSILSLILIVYFIMDIFVFEKYLRFTFSTYLQLGIALAGILVKNWNLNEPCTYFALVLAIIGPGIMFTTKLISTILKSR